MTDQTVINIWQKLPTHTVDFKILSSLTKTISNIHHYSQNSQNTNLTKLLVP